MERTSDTILKEIFHLEGDQEKHEQLVEEYTEARRRELAIALNTLPFSLSCANCDCDSPVSYEEANAQGWQNIQPDETGWSWNFLGMCPDCIAEEEREDEELKKREMPRSKPEQDYLF